MGTYLPLATLTVLAVTGLVGMEVYRQADTVPAREIEYICNGMAGGCTGEPVISPFILALVAAGALAIVLRFRKQRADEEE